MASKMSMMRGGEDSIVGYVGAKHHRDMSYNDSCYNKRVANYTYTNEYESDNDYEDEDDFYDHYETYEEEFDDGEYQPFIPEEEEEITTTSPNSLFKKITPCFLKKLNSPTKSAEKSPTKTQSPTWWDKNKTIAESERMINGVLNYAALLPPPTPKIEVVEKPPSKKTKKNKKNSGNGAPKETIKKENTVEKKNHKKQQLATPTILEVQKPTRFCLSVIKKSKCFHGAQCRFAHDYSDLKECNFGEKCKKITVVKTNPDGTLELSNKNEVGCNFKHAKESKASYLKRVPQQHTSPKK
jgi:hypothetical protein